MLKGLAKLIGFKTTEPEAPLPPPKVDNATELLDPGAPYSHGEPVPRWPEHGAALVAADPAALVQTQAELIRRLRGFSPLTPQQFDSLIMPIFHRYAAWVHLLPASEAHHHYGPGGLLTHGFEVALHAARIADGKQVGVELNPSERAKYQPRWKVATMLGGLFHDIGKPLVDCGATCTNNKLSWPSMDTSLFAWLQANKLTHYRIYWKSGPRHERHKAVGTSVIREIIGPEMLAWLADEPVQEVTSLLMMSVAHGKVPGNLMSAIVSAADSLSVEADLKRLAQRQQATGQGGNQSVAALIIAELRRQIESNNVEINKPGGRLWHTTAGTFGLFPGILHLVKPELVKKQVPGLPALDTEIAQLLAETGFIEPCEDPETKNYAAWWSLSVDVEHKGTVTTTSDLRGLRFKGTDFLFGNLPLPKEVPGTATPPFMTADAVKAIAASVQVADEPQSIESALGQPEAPTAVQAAPAGDAPAQPSAPPVAAPEASGDGPHIEDRRNRRDLASERSIEDQRRREKAAANKQLDAAELLSKLESSGFAGPAIAEVLRRIAARKLVWGEDVFETSDGLIIKYPSGFERLGMPATDLLGLVGQNKWLVTDTGSDRQVTDRKFPNGSLSKCVILTNQVLRTWEAIRTEHPQILEGKPVQLVTDDDMGTAPTPAPPPAPAAEKAAPPPPPRPQGQQQRPQAPQPGSAPRQGPNQQRPQREGGQQRDSGQQPAKPAAAPPRQAPAPAQSGAGGGSPNPNRQDQQRPSQQTAATQASAPRPTPAPGGQRQEKPLRPAGGAAPAPGRDPNAPGKEMSFESSGDAAKAATAAPTPTAPTAPTAEMEMRPPSYERREFPRDIKDLKCQKLDDITPQKAEWINGVVMRMIGLKMHSQGIDVNDHSQPDQATLKVMLHSFLTKNDVIRQAPFVTALSNKDNPLFIFKKPDSLRLEDIGEIKRNPDYVVPEWVFNPPGRPSLLQPNPTPSQ